MCKHIPMADDVIEVVNQMGEDDGSPDGNFFHNIHKESTIEDMYGGINSQDNSSCASDKSCDMKKDDGQEDQKIIVYNVDMEQDEISDLKKDLLHLRNGLGDNINDANNKLQYIEVRETLNEDAGQGNSFGNANNNPLANNIPLKNNIPLAQNKHFGGTNNNDDDDNDNNNNNNEN